MHKHLQSAINLARNHEYDECLSYRHTCIIFRGGSIISVGYNSITKNSFVDDIVRKVGVKDGHSPTCHAEMSAILAVRNKIDLTGCKAAVARIKPTGVGNSRPCALCQSALKRYGIKKALYTIDDKSFGVLRV